MSYGSSLQLESTMWEAREPNELLVEGLLISTLSQDEFTLCKTERSIIG